MYDVQLSDAMQLTSIFILTLTFKSYPTLEAAAGLNGLASGLALLDTVQRASVIATVGRYAGNTGGVLVTVESMANAVAKRGSAVVTVALSAVYLSYKAIK